MHSNTVDKMKLTIEIPGINQIISRAIAKNAKKMALIKKEVILVAVNVQAQAKINQTPHVDTGNLRDNIDMSSAFALDSMESEVGSNVEYAGYHEAQYPYLLPAVNKYENGFKQALKAIINE